MLLAEAGSGLVPGICLGVLIGILSGMCFVVLLDNLTTGGNATAAVASITGLGTFMVGGSWGSGRMLESSDPGEMASWYFLALAITFTPFALLGVYRYLTRGLIGRGAAENA